MRIVALEAEDVDLGSGNQELAFDVDTGDVHEDTEALDSDDEDDMDVDIEGTECKFVMLWLGAAEASSTSVPMHIIPLYSLLPSDKQMRVFAPPPPGSRLVVVSTNVAETSLTIPGIRYVVDCGRAKEVRSNLTIRFFLYLIKPQRMYDAASGIQSFQINWISKASAAQRAGRAGRTGPGHCYRLYSSALYEHYFESFSEPEILRTPIEGVVLQMKAMNIDAVVNFPFPTPPDSHTLKKAETMLTRLGALTSSSFVSSNSMQTSVTAGTIGGKITSLGRSMSLFPLAPRHARMLVSGQQHGCLPYVITIVSILSVGDPFLREEGLVDVESSDSEGQEVEHINRDQIRIKEVRRIRRRGFFEKQQVRSWPQIQ